MIDANKSLLINSKILIIAIELYLKKEFCYFMYINFIVLSLLSLPGGKKFKEKNIQYKKMLIAGKFKVQTKSTKER